MYRVLIVEDDNMIGDMLSMYLTEEGYDVRRVENGGLGKEAVNEFVPDLIILDLMLPDMNGMQLCTELRNKSAVPILIISMKTEVSERVNALIAGADDYLCKPFSMRELTARVTALIRRSHLMRFDSGSGGEVAAAASGQTARSDSIHLDLDRRAVLVDNRVVDTTFSEFEIMKLFCAYPGKVFSREELINELRGFDSYVTDRSIDVHIANLRKKIESDPKDPKHIKTVWGVGYKFVYDA
ncbi:response regulator transcription factor [Paenibacillus thermoaerophilus]|uniref:Response regulator transcription factor n=1 Tax=Paenibacillus thermoaerophilus TaxID=1215385 RepID=A0ABW2V4J3_9BACL|nr:response regulator transcription factor [Paenibacillus thermoaerophilus]TMV17438.1 response regulator transcription factor [Paenibacillus thermoaerophilus]